MQVRAGGRPRSWASLGARAGHPATVATSTRCSSRLSRSPRAQWARSQCRVAPHQRVAGFSVARCPRWAVAFGDLRIGLCPPPPPGVPNAPVHTHEGASAPARAQRRGIDCSRAHRPRYAYKGKGTDDDDYARCEGSPQTIDWRPARSTRLSRHTDSPARPCPRRVVASLGGAIPPPPAGSGSMRAPSIECAALPCARRLCRGAAEARILTSVAPPPHGVRGQTRARAPSPSGLLLALAATADGVGDVSRGSGMNYGGGDDAGDASVG
jgi:hypothetical protein